MEHPPCKYCGCQKASRTIEVRVVRDPKAMLGIHVIDAKTREVLDHKIPYYGGDTPFGAACPGDRIEWEMYGNDLTSKVRVDYQILAVEAGA